MDYLEIKDQLSSTILNLSKQLESKDLAKEEYEEIKRTINNYQYILELTDMNHFERGQIQ
ncbi:DUF3896 family protein [Bacillus massilinigeriensis]|uniref:DUF3896 family protein n=1 Tax=Bacillus massilionigeriensis TaxID=1805475 RepID=UPI00096B3D55|nr:DUF3896 family protein [Bacillus massilionigeriensis]